MKDQEIRESAAKAGDDLRAGKGNDDLSAVIKDIDDAKAKMTPKEYDTFLKELNKNTSKDLPEVEIVDTTVQNGKHQLVIENEHNKIKSNLDSNEAEKLDANLKHEKRGELSVGTNDKGEVESITDKYGNAYLKTADGNWTYRSSYGNTDYEVRNVQVDDKGNLSWEHGNERFNHKADGGMTVDHLYDGSQTVYDKDYRVVEAPSGDGKHRTFKYKGDKLDEVDGNLGHWQRVEKEGKTEWHNTDTKAVWKGDFEVGPYGDLKFKSREGQSWQFTTSGESVPIKKSA